MKVCSKRTPGSVNFSFYQPRGVTGLFVMNHDESNPSLCTSLTTVRDFFFLLAFASCLTPMILGQHLSLKVFYFYFFKTASKRCKRAYRALLMILSETKPARSLDTSSLFPGLFPAIRINKTQQLLCRMYPTSPIMLFLPVSQEYPHIIKKRFCVP